MKRHLPSQEAAQFLLIPEGIRGDVRERRAGYALWWWFVFAGCLAMAAGGARYLLRRPSGHFGQQYLLLLLHIVPGIVVMLTGPWQFSLRFRQRNVALHRWLGRIYLCGVAVGGSVALALSPRSQGGLPSHLGFAAAAAAWLFTGWMAYRRIIERDVAAHRVWMIRNFSISFAAVTFRIYLLLLAGPARWPYAQAYALGAWMAWVPNLLLSEWIIGRHARDTEEATLYRPAVSSNASCPHAAMTSCPRE